jgi:hypothetical protein
MSDGTMGEKKRRTCHNGGLLHCCYHSQGGRK